MSFKVGDRVRKVNEDLFSCGSEVLTVTKIDSNKLRLSNGGIIHKRSVELVKETTPKEENDPVNQPSHYTYGDIETIDYIEQVANLYKPKQAVSAANVIKYISRAPLKNGKQDIDKAIWYLERLRGLM